LFLLPLFRSSPTDNITQVKESVKSKTHVLALAKQLTKKIPGHVIQESFLVRLAVLVGTPLTTLLATHVVYRDMCSPMIQARDTGHPLTDNSKRWRKRSQRNGISEYLPGKSF
jgi:hypothetical protein